MFPDPYYISWKPWDEMIHLLLFVTMDHRRAHAHLMHVCHVYFTLGCGAALSWSAKWTHGCTSLCIQLFLGVKRERVGSVWFKCKLWSFDACASGRVRTAARLWSLCALFFRRRRRRICLIRCFFRMGSEVKIFYQLTIKLW